MQFTQLKVFHFLTQFLPLQFLFLLFFLPGCKTAVMLKNPYETATKAEQNKFKRVIVPLASGEAFFISQGAFGKASHSELGNEYSWDFDVAYGTDVVAVEEGSVFQVWQPNSGGGCDKKWSDSTHNIKIQHSDGSVAQYVHIKTSLKPGDRVSKGQVIAKTAMNGWICQPQLHFSVYASKDNLYNSSQRKTLPLYFIGFGILHEGENGVTP